MREMRPYTVGIELFLTTNHASRDEEGRISNLPRLLPNSPEEKLLEMIGALLAEIKEAGVSVECEECSYEDENDQKYIIEGDICDDYRILISPPPVSNGYNNGHLPVFNYLPLRKIKPHWVR